MLYVSDSYSRINSAKYLYSNYKKANIETIYLFEEPYILHPTLDEDWVENGFRKAA